MQILHYILLHTDQNSVRSWQTLLNVTLPLPFCYCSRCDHSFNAQEWSLLLSPDTSWEQMHVRCRFAPRTSTMNWNSVVTCTRWETLQWQVMWAWTPTTRSQKIWWMITKISVSYTNLCEDVQWLPNSSVSYTNLGEDVLRENVVMVLPDSLDCHRCS
jgi:hypothetical protein